MWIYTTLLFSFLISCPLFASVSINEIEGRFAERFGSEIFLLAKKAEMFPKEEFINEENINKLIEEIEHQYFSLLYLYYRTEIAKLLEKVEYPSLQSWKQLIGKIHFLPVTLESMSLYFVIFKSLKLIAHFPSLRHSNYSNYQITMLEKMFIELENMRAIDEYPKAASYEHVRFVGELVFKHQINRAKEIGCYELACMLGLDEVFVPSEYVFFTNRKGLIQPFIASSIPWTKRFWFTTYRWIEYSNYLFCALGVLLFALEDMHPGNMYYVPIKNGYFQSGFFDCVGSFTCMHFHEFNGKGYRVLFTPYAWIGFDYPQYQYPFNVSDKEKLTSFAKKWINLRSEISAYMNHGLCEMFLSNHEKREMINRFDHMIHIILNENPSTVEYLHLAFSPEYKIVREKLCEFFPQHQPMYTLFKLIWRPEYTLEKLNEKRREEFLNWIANFLQYLQTK